MLSYKREFIEFAVRRGALRFGNFTLKSGRQSPYFFNTGAFDSGAALSELGRAYAAAMVAGGIEFDLIFGPAYKGIPLGAAIAIALYRDHGRDIPFCFNRKETKDHGEGGDTLGAQLSGRVLIVDDVISSGASVNEAMQIIVRAGAQATGIMISLDRRERGRGELSAAQEITRDHGIVVDCIVGVEDILEYLRDGGEHEQEVIAIERYRREFGV